MAAARSHSRPTRKGKLIAPRYCGWRLMSPMNSYQKILCQIEHSVARITLNRPEKRNSLNPELISEIKDAIRASARDENVRVVLIRGAGADFCSGADLSGLHERAEAGPLENMVDARNMAELFIEIRHHPHPIIAAVQGRAR